MSKYRIPKGTADLFGEEVALHQYILEKANQIFSAFGFSEIRTPVFEHTELFLRGIGDDSDIVNKEMYTFEDKGKRSITLRPEGTAGVVRAYVEKHFAQNAPHQRFFYFAPMFRYERPQKGRMRQFHQLGIELFGQAKPYFDAEIIKMLTALLDDFKLSEYQIVINNVGCMECRPLFNEKLKDYLAACQENLCADCQRRLLTNPLRVFDCKNPQCKSYLEDAPKITDCSCDACKEHYSEFISWMDAFGIQYVQDPYMVRGFDYYTRVAFEFKSSLLGAQDAFLGGGRYDNLVKELGGPAVPATGAGIGIERLVLLLQAAGFSLPVKPASFYIPCFNKDLAANAGVFVTALLRNQNFTTWLGDYDASFKKQMKDANRMKCDYVLIIGEDELQDQKIVVKDMADGSQQQLTLSDFITFLNNKGAKIPAQQNAAFSNLSDLIK